jgi:hypothetical protein
VLECVSSSSFHAVANSILERHSAWVKELKIKNKILAAIGKFLWLLFEKPSEQFS